jgi:hypothetical protein
VQLPRFARPPIAQIEGNGRGDGDAIIFGDHVKWRFLKDGASAWQQKREPTGKARENRA